MGSVVGFGAKSMGSVVGFGVQQMVPIVQTVTSTLAPAVWEILRAGGQGFFGDNWLIYIIAIVGIVIFVMALKKGLL